LEGILDRIRRTMEVGRGGKEGMNGMGGFIFVGWIGLGLELGIDRGRRE
jgi:hypothetical protein